MNKIKLSRNPNAPPETLSSLALDEYWEVRFNVAEHKNTPAETLQMLATDEHRWVRYYVGRNPNSTEIIRRLVIMTNTKENEKS
jgi:NADH:ubiquinone oxidoreductase subunit